MIQIVIFVRQLQDGSHAGELKEAAKPSKNIIKQSSSHFYSELGSVQLSCQYTVQKILVACYY